MRDKEGGRKEGINKEEELSNTRFLGPTKCTEGYVKGESIRKLISTIDSA